MVRNDPFQRLVGGLRLVGMGVFTVWEVRTYTLPSPMMEAQLVPRLLTGAETMCARVLDRDTCHPPGDSKELRTEERQTEASLLRPTIDSVLGEARRGGYQSRSEPAHSFSPHMRPRKPDRARI